MSNGTCHTSQHDTSTTSSNWLQPNHCKEEYSLTPFTIQNNLKINMNQNISNVDLK
jgi:hypothetical protein